MATMPTSTSFKDELAKALPSGIRCKVRYIHTPSSPCDALFSPMPGSDPEKTRLASHFLTVSIDPASLPHAPENTNGPGRNGPQDVLSLGIEVLVYTTKRLTTIFVSKVDSTSYTPRHIVSPIRTTVTTFLKWLAERTREKRPKRKVVISLFARAQAQYLFPGSSDNKQKHVLDDRQLIKWWAKTLDPILPTSDDGDVKYQGYVTVPGYRGSELRQFMPPSVPTATSQPHWLPGHPLAELAQSRGLPEHAPPRSLLPRFPDDPKARFIMNLDETIGLYQDSKVTVSPSKRKSGRWGSVSTLDQFWEQMEFRQECSSGRAVGFLWLVIAPAKDDDDEISQLLHGNVESQESVLTAAASDPASDALGETPSSPAKRQRRTRLTGPIVPRQPRLKGGSSSLSSLTQIQGQLDAKAGDGIMISKEGYDQAMQTLLRLDFSTLSIAIQSSNKWFSEIISVAGLNGDFAFEVEGTAEIDSPAGSGAMNGKSAVNDLGGMVRKKRKAVDQPGSEGPVEALATGTAAPERPAVNVLGGGTIRKKPKVPVA